MKLSECGKFFVLRVYEDRGIQTSAQIKFSQQFGIKFVKPINSLENDDEESVREVLTQYIFDPFEAKLEVLMKAYKVASFALYRDWWYWFLIDSLSIVQ